MPSFARPALARHARLGIDPLTKEPVLLSQEAVIEINRTGYEILLQCDGTRSVAEIAEDLAIRYPIDKAMLIREVSAYIEQLNQRGLLQWS
jgi:pyrroloquinoline quinone biosynthesis protein D